MNTASTLEPRAFVRDGYHVARGLCPEELRQCLLDVSRRHLEGLLGPLEYEADVGYPGSPRSRQAEGGNTPRRLRHALSRDPLFRRWATGPEVSGRLTTLFAEMHQRPFEPGEVLVSQCHHNCVMTKHPGYSSATLWHQDIRYWSFDRPELISVWLALGPENARNGALKVIPGSHLLDLDRGRLDGALFLRTDLEENADLIRLAVPVELAAGDVVFFHCRLFHAAGMNLTGEVKLSVVFTCHAAENRPIPDTRSADLPGIPLQPAHPREVQ